MKDIFVKIYIGFLVVSVLLVTYMLMTTKRDERHREVLGGYDIVRDYDYQRSDSQRADTVNPLGIQEEYTFHFDQTGGVHRTLVFYTFHQNVDVFLGQERIYRMKPDIKNEFGRTSGYVWNQVMLQETDAGRTVRVVLYPIYKSSIGVQPLFYYGDRYTIFMDRLRGQFPLLLLCLIGILAGLLYVGYGILNYRNEEMDNSLLLLGVFAILISSWKLTDCEGLYILFPKLAGMYIVPFLMLKLICPPFILFIRGLSSTRESKLWDVPIIVSLVGMGITIVLQVLNIFDMRQLLWMTHGELIIGAGITLYMMISEIRSKGMNAKLRRNLLFLLICLFGMTVDMIVYYASSGVRATCAGMIAFIIYIIASGVSTLKDAKQLMTIGLQARTFERKAYHDQLTGLFNRMAYSDYISGENFTSERCIVAVFDLNNLKKCNDTLGHEKGDIYIKECAQIIQDTFQDIGRCYRMGGDEFCAILEHTSLEECKKRVKRLHEAVKERNRKNPEIEMGIACGYERFDKRTDYDINDTSRRADKMMYHEKFAMKAQAQEQAKASS